MSRHPDSGGPAGELPSRDSPVSPDRRRDPPGPARRGRAHLLRARVLQAVQGEPADHPAGARRPRGGRASLPSRGARHLLDTVGRGGPEASGDRLGRRIKLMEQVVDAALAPRAIAELLQVRPRSPLLRFERTYFAVSGEPVEYAITYQMPRRYPYRLVLSRAERRS